MNGYGTGESPNVVQTVNPLFNTTPAKESAPLGAEIRTETDSTGWTLGEGWSGNCTDGFSHSSGTATLVRAMTNTGTKYYQISFDTSAALATGELTLSIGNSVAFDLYVGNATSYAFGIRSVSDGDLVFTPATGFNKTISNISIKEITGVFDPAIKITDSALGIPLEIRSTLESLSNVFIGLDSGEHNTNGTLNIGIGASALKDNTSGFWNVSVGANSLLANTVGSRNVAIGYNTLKTNISGQRNIGIGSFALAVNTIGNKNVAIGSDSMMANTSGSYNVAIGMSSLYKNTTGEYNVGIGLEAGYALTTGIQNIAIGKGSLHGATDGANNIAIGVNARYSGNGSDNVAIGMSALHFNATGINNVAIGSSAGMSASGKSVSYNVFIGYRAGLKVETGADRNVLIGYQAGDSITTGAGNILIGYNIDVDAATDSDKLVIGNLIKGNMAAGSLNVELMGGLKLASIPTADPHVAGQVWNNNNVLTVSAG